MHLFELIGQIIFRVFLDWLEKPDPRLPPFPRKPLLLVGNLFHLEADPRSQFKEWRKQCGDIFSINMSGKLMVVLSGYDVIKEALVTKADVFSHRSSVFIVEATGFPDKGIVFASGPNWKEQKSVSSTILRKLGIGRNILAERVQEEVNSYIDFLASSDGQTVNIQDKTNHYISNIFCSIIFGWRYHSEDKDFKNLLLHRDFIASKAHNTNAINFIPWLKYLPGDFFNAKELVKHVQEMMGDLKRIVDKTKDDVGSHDVNNFIEGYIADKNQKFEAGVSTFVGDENLHRNLFDLLVAGLETTSTTIYWCVLYMLNHPDIQEKVYCEIKEQVPTERTPNMHDRSKLPYLNAVIMETQRLASIVPFSLPYKCIEDVTLRGYFIPKGTFIIPSMDSVLHDQTIWGEDAMTFRPDRFLNADGKLVDRQELIPFGIGRRVCLGESLAKTELFLFLSNMFQKFRFLPVGETPPSCTDYVVGLAWGPRPYEVKIVSRE